MTYQTGFRIRTSGWPQATGPAPRIAQARVERPAYDQDGNHRPAIFMDYLLPTTCDIPRIVTAIEDALAPFGVRICEQHPRSARILELIAAANLG